MIERLRAHRDGASAAGVEDAQALERLRAMVASLEAEAATLPPGAPGRGAGRAPRVLARGLALTKEENP